MFCIAATAFFVPRMLEKGAADTLFTKPLSRVVLLLSPPFDTSAQDPGYIRGYPPGVRENGGQYTHAAVWAVMAVARLGSGDEAMELFHMLNPINHSRTGADADRYRTEPYALAGDVYSHPAHPGRGGWTWYTGAAGWLYRTGLESLLGLRRQGATFAIDPCIPASWPEYAIAWKVGAAGSLGMAPSLLADAGSHGNAFDRYRSLFDPGARPAIMRTAL